MNHEATIIFPHQLFENNVLISKNRPVFIVEDQRFFTDFAFHKHKLMLHRATMRSYYDHLKKKNTVIYLDYYDAKQLFDLLIQKKINKIHFFDPVDFILEERLEKQAKKKKIELCSYETPQFMTEQAWLNDYYNDESSYFMAPFYKEQRKRLNILMTQNGKPQGGSWSYDVQNRYRIPSSVSIPEYKKFEITHGVKEAAQYVNEHFANNPGSTDSFWFATTHEESKEWYGDFLKKRFALFGPYEDAIVAGQTVLFHSVLSPYLNCGLLTPDYVIHEAILFARKHSVPLNSLEGFIRQIIGWREFMRAVYVMKGQEERTINFWKHTWPLPKSFWNATTGIDPVDCALKKVIHNAYVHHIERLMIIGNFMLLCEFDPKAVYAWFMELFIDSYDWVMVPNIYGMSQYADGGIFATKPYISSSHYILKMSDFKKGPWCAIWDSLYWRFIYKHKKYFSSLGRLAVMNYQLKRMNAAEIRAHVKKAEQFLHTFY